MARVAIGGLEHTEYIDKVAGGARVRQDEPVTIVGETDRIYLHQRGLHGRRPGAGPADCDREGQ